MKFIDQRIVVEARLLPDGQVEPLAFAWQGRRCAVTGTGRRWESTDEGTPLRHYLVQTADSDVFELQLDPASGEWRLVRAWLQGRIA